MDDLTAYVLLAGVVLMWAVLAYTGYTNLLSRLPKRKAGRRVKKAPPAAE